VRRIRALIDELRRVRFADTVGGILDVVVRVRDGTTAVTGETTHPEVAAELIALIAALPDAGTVVDEIVRLPDATLGEDTNALVTAALAPVLALPRNDAAQISQYVLGNRLELLSRRGAWYRIRGEDGYVGWVHRGYLQAGPVSWALAWERAEAGEPAVSLGAELVDDEERVVARAPWGARLIKDSPARVRLPDGRRGTIGSGEIVEVDRLHDRFPHRSDSIARTARRWLGAPYLWGGVTLWGVDCSGFVQAVFWMHGIALPRDSYQQAKVGVTIEPGTDFGALRPADLVFFAEGAQGAQRITHVAISLGGSELIHSAISLGGVGLSDLAGSAELDRHLRRRYVCARRFLPDDA
jgi:gamma-D-glutamyl-L-lysine dipeptidyl-peptidase